MAERGEGGIFEALAGPNLETLHGVHRIDIHVHAVALVRHHAVVGVELRGGDRIGFHLEQVDDRRAVQPHVLRRETHVVGIRFMQHHLDIEVGHVFGHRLHVEPEQIHEHELLGEGEILEQELIATERVIRFGPQSFVGGKAGRLKTQAWHRLWRAGSIVGVARHADLHRQRFGGQRRVQAQRDGTIGMQVEAQTWHLQLRTLGLRLDREAQTQHRAAIVARGRLRLGEAQRIEIDRLRGAIDAFDGGVAGGRTQRDRIGYGFETRFQPFVPLQRTLGWLQFEDRQRRNHAQVMRPQQADQALGQLR